MASKQEKADRAARGSEDRDTSAATADDINVPAGEKQVWYNKTPAVHPRNHQPAMPEAAERANEDAAARRAPNADVDESSPPGIAPVPKQEVVKADEVNEKVSEQNREGK